MYDEMTLSLQSQAINLNNSSLSVSGTVCQPANALNNPAVEKSKNISFIWKSFMGKMKNVRVKNIVRQWSENISLPEGSPVRYHLKLSGV